MAHLLIEHCRHGIRHGPHALADLRAPAQPAGKARIHIPILIGLDPGGTLHVILANDSTRFHGRVDFIAGAIQEARIDEDHAILGRCDTGLQVHGGAASLIHDAHLQRGALQAQRIFHAGEQRIRPSHFFRPMHFGLHDVNAAGARIQPLAANIMHRNSRCAEGIQNGLRHLRAIQLHRINHHVVADITHQHDRTPMERDGATRWALKNAVRVEAADHGLAAFLKTRFQIAAHQAKPIAIDRDLVFRIHGSDGILAILNGGQRAFQHHIGNARRIGLADWMRAIKAHFDMQAVIDEKQRRRSMWFAQIAHALARPCETRLAAILQRHFQGAAFNAVARGIAMRSLCERHGAIQYTARIGYHLRTAFRVITLAGSRTRNGIRAIKRIIQAAPARIGGIQRVARIGHRHDQLRPSHGGDFRIHIRGADRHIWRFRQQIADLLQEGRIGRLINRLGGVGAVPGINLFLQGVALGEQRGIGGHHLTQRAFHRIPETRGLHASARQGFGFNEILQNGGNKKPL